MPGDQEPKKPKTYFDDDTNGQNSDANASGQNFTEDAPGKLEQMKTISFKGLKIISLGVLKVGETILKYPAAFVLIGTTGYLYFSGTLTPIISLLQNLNKIASINLIAENRSEIEKVVIEELGLKSEIPLASINITETATEKEQLGLSATIMGKEIRTPAFHRKNINLTVAKSFSIKAIPIQGDIAQAIASDDGEVLKITIPFNAIRVVPNTGTIWNVNNKDTSISKKVLDGINPTGASNDDNAARANVENRIYDRSLENGESYYNDLMRKTKNGTDVGALNFLGSIIENTLKSKGIERKVIILVNFEKTKILGYNGSVIFQPPK